jgi:hypothetical protein
MAVQVQPGLATCACRCCSRRRSFLLLASPEAVLFPARTCVSSIPLLLLLLPPPPLLLLQLLLLLLLPLLLPPPLLLLSPNPLLQHWVEQLGAWRPSTLLRCRRAGVVTCSCPHHLLLLQGTCLSQLVARCCP